MTSKLSLLLALFALPLVLSAQALDSSSSGTQIIDDSIQTLEQVEQTLQLYQSNIAQLQKVIATLQSDSNTSIAELKKQQDLLDSYMSRAKALQDRYAELLKISEKLRSSLTISKNFNYVLAGSLVVAVIVIIVQAVIKK